MPKEPEIVHLNGLKARIWYDDDAMNDHAGEEVELHGSFIVDEHHPVEPSNYVWSAYDTLVAVRWVEGDPFYDVDSELLWRHIDPEGARKQDIIYAEIEVHDLEEELRQTHESPLVPMHSIEYVERALHEARKRLAELQGDS